MNKGKQLGTKCRRQQESKKISSIEEVPVKKSMKSDIGNDSLKCPFESRLSGHSTPITKKDYVYDVEDSPELDYHCSPISFPCTQEGGNEIAWDWQTHASKTSNEKTKSQNNFIETPKRKKQLQKKRNTNSPLLQKPLKRKLVKMENIENIGKLTAELKALSDKMNSMKQNLENHISTKQDDIKNEPESKLLIELDNKSSDDDMFQDFVNNDLIEIETVTMDNKSKKDTHYEDLFDDSIDDSMVKCSQEVEKKLNLCKSNGKDVMELSVLEEKDELVFICEIKKQHVTTHNSSENSKNSSISKSSSSISSSSHLKTYSNNSHKVNSLCNSTILNSKDTSLKNSCAKIINIQSGKHMLQEKKVSEFPDDSFDDCLLTCVENDDKLISKLSEYDFNISNTDLNLNNSKKLSKQTSSDIVNNKKTPNKINLNVTGSICDAKSTNHDSCGLISDDLPENINSGYDKETIQKMFSGKSALENRKFFKTKSLSDQVFYQNRNFNSYSKVNKPSTTGQVSSNPVLSSAKRFQSNSSSSAVSNSYPIVKSQYLNGGNRLPPNNGMENTHALNRLEEKEAGKCIVKYKSTTNLYSAKEVAKESQSVQCTPEEIERKRLEAKMRLEAKRKLQQNSKSAGPLLQVPMKKSVKR